jgi:SNF2 family DNA or RNA helicase
MYVLDSSDDWIFVHSDSVKIQADLLESGAIRTNTVNAFAFPPSRESIFAIESADSPTFVTENYEKARKNILYFPDELVEQYSSFLKHKGWVSSVAKHQIEFCHQALSTKFAYNASEQGTGKTRSVWAFLTCLHHDPLKEISMIVCPKSLYVEWVNECRKIFAPDSDHSNTDSLPFKFVNLCEGSKEDKCKRFEDAIEQKKKKIDSRPIILIANYQSFNADSRKRTSQTLQKTLTSKIKNGGAIVFDEALYIKNPKSNTWRNIKLIRQKFEYCLPLCGTPISVSVTDLYGQLVMMEKSILGMTYSMFESTYTRHIEEEIRYKSKDGESGGSRKVRVIVGAKNLPHLMSTISGYWYRATKLSVSDLPEKIYHDPIQIRLTKEQEQWYKALQQYGLSALGDSESLGGAQNVMIRLMQVCGGHVFSYNDGTIPPFGNQRYENPEDYEYQWTVRGEGQLFELPCAKTEWVKNFVQERLEYNPTHRIIIFCIFNSEVHRITRELKSLIGDDKVCAVTGQTDDLSLLEWKKSFQDKTSNGIQVIVGQIAKMAYGHNLQATDTTIYFSNPWSYARRSQSEDRSHRMGRVGPCEYYDLTTVLSNGKQTTDNYIIEKLKKHEQISNKVSIMTFLGQNDV